MIIFQSGRFWKQSACRECLAPARTWMQCCIPRQFDFQAGCFDSLWFAVQISVWCKTSPTWFATGMFSLSVNKLVLFFMFFFAYVCPFINVLLQCWMVLKNTRKFSWRLHSVYRILFSLRARMQFFVDNLQYYLQVDVLSFSLSISKVA
jgi:hypothetical protein